MQPFGFHSDLRDCKCGHNVWAHDNGRQGRRRDSWWVQMEVSGRVPCIQCDCRDYKADPDG